MSYSISGTTINLTRGDTCYVRINITDSDGVPYIPSTGDKVRFAMKTAYTDRKPVLVKEIPIDTMMLVLTPEDTAELEFGRYVYDVELTTAAGEVDTFITKAKFNLTEEVY